MNILDWILVIWLGIAFLSGLRFGFISRLGQVIGFIVGLWFVVRYQGDLTRWLPDNMAWGLGSRIIILIVLGEAAGLGVVFLNKIFRVFAWLPLAKTTNAALGGVISLLGHTVIISLALALADQLIPSAILAQTIDESVLGGFFLSLGQVLVRFIPTSLTHVG